MIDVKIKSTQICTQTQKVDKHDLTGLIIKGNTGKIKEQQVNQSSIRANQCPICQFDPENSIANQPL